MSDCCQMVKSETNCQIVVLNIKDINGIRRLGSVPATSTLKSAIYVAGFFVYGCVKANNCVVSEYSVLIIMSKLPHQN